MLYRQGYTNVEGVDGCPEMLARGRELPEHGRIKLSPCPWGEARQVLENRGSFDCIFLLGNSVAHFEKGQIKDLLALLADHLSPDGMLAFDMRNWTRAASGALVEAGRPVNVYRWLGEIRLGDRRFWVDDVCAYGEERQYISYRFRRMAVNDIGWDFEESPLIKVSYATFDMDEACAWLKAAGCDHGSIETQLPCGWSYIVVSARRSR
jgi:SAM-dependent methyltransferase